MERPASQKHDVRPLAPVLTAGLFPGERAALVELLRALTDEQWQAPTACPGWSCKDVALHLLGGDLGNLSRRRDEFDGNRASGFTANLGDPASLLAFINDWNQQWVQASRRISPPVLCDLLAITGDWLHAYYASLDLFAMGGPVSWAGPQPAPVWLDVAREYTEHWTHQQHIRDAVGRPGFMERHWFAPVLATFIHALPHTLRAIERPDGAALQMTITGEAGGQWFAVRTHGVWRITDDLATKPTASIELDQETAWRLFSGGHESVEAAPRATFHGDDRLARTALSMRSMIV